MSKYSKNKNNKKKIQKISLNSDENECDKNKIYDEKKDIEKKDEEVMEVINLDSNNNVEELSQSLENLLLDKEFAEPVKVKKENKLITNYHYATFKNSYGENTCYINVILHLLYKIDELAEFLIYIYQIDESNKSSENNDKNIDDKNNNNESDNKDNNNEINEFLISIGNIINKYDEIIKENDVNNKRERYNKNKKSKEDKDKQVTVIDTLKMRKILEKLSNNKFQLNTIADPVELFTFILDILNENLKGDTHKSFYLELIDEYNCGKNGCNQIQNKYDKDNFMYHIYIDDILKYIQTDNKKVKYFKHKLFEFSYNSFKIENAKICGKCNNVMDHRLICKNCPDYILINCVWKESNPILDDVMTIFYLMSLRDDISNLFVYPNNKHNKRNNYYLYGFILYSFTLSHYIICTYNYEKEVFVLRDDEVVKEYNKLYNLIIDITVEVLKTNGKAFFYPVMLIYTKEELYTYEKIKINTLYDYGYQNIINKCSEAIYDYQTQNEANEETKSNNLQKLIQEQKAIEEEIRRKKTENEKNNKMKDMNQKNNDEGETDVNNQNNINEIIIKEDEEDNKNIEEEDKKEEKRKSNVSKDKKEKKEKNEDNKDDEMKKKRSKSKKKDKIPENENEVEKEENKQNSKKTKENNPNNIQEMKPNTNLKNSKNKHKKSLKNKNINELIWNEQDNYVNSSKRKTSKEKEIELENDSNNKYLGKKINNPEVKKDNKRRNNYNDKHW